MHPVSRLALLLGVLASAASCGNRPPPHAPSIAKDAALAAERPAPAGDSLPAGGPRIDCGRAVRRAAQLVRAAAWVDAHLVSEVARLWCADASLLETDAVALVHLDEGPRARALLDPVRQGTLPGDRERAEVLHAWSFLAERDEAAFSHDLAGLPRGAAARLRARAAVGDRGALRAAIAPLSPALQRRVLEVHERHEEARQRAPWLAGLLSAAVPGAGQVYAGSLESGAVALVLNAVSIAATIELARDEHYFSAGLVGVAASVFYVGNIIGAVDLARLANDRAQAPWKLELDRVLLPELDPTGGQ